MTATKTKPKTLKEMRRGEQVVYLLLEHGPMTVWELVDQFKTSLREDVLFENLKKVLLNLRKNDQAGIVNYKKEQKRQKMERYGYYGTRKRTQRYGRSLGGEEYVEVWGAAKE